jgi:biotin transport system substrate-specific component
MSIVTLPDRFLRTHRLSHCKSETKLTAVFQVLLASFFIACCAEIKIPLYFTPIPLSGSTFGVILIGALLGSRKGAMAVLCYLIERFIGLPLWVGDYANFYNLVDASGGYRFAWVLQAFFVGWFLERSAFHYAKTIFILFLACCIQMGIGTLWLGCFVGFKNVMTMGFYPFVPGEFLKVCWVALYLKTRKNSKELL